MDRLFRKAEDMPEGHKALLKLCEDFAKTKEATDFRFIYEYKEIYKPRFGMFVLEGKGVSLLDAKDGSSIAYAHCTTSGTAKRFTVLEKGHVIHYRLTQFPDLPDDAVAGLWVDLPKEP